MKQYEITLTIGLFDKDTCKQEVTTAEAISLIQSILIDRYGVYAFTLTECSGVYRMQSTGCIVKEPSIRVEIVTDTYSATVYADMIQSLKAALNQETIMIKKSAVDVDFI